MKKTPTENSVRERRALEKRYAEQRHDAMFTLALGGVSIAALFWYYAHQQILLYGDAVAHINIARRVLDNRSWLSFFFQLGTVWLPLPHILMLPFVWNKALWMSGIAGSIPTMVAYIVGTLGIFRLVRARAGARACLRRGWNLRTQPEPAVHAEHGDERAALPGVFHLGDCLFR